MGSIFSNKQSDITQTQSTPVLQNDQQLQIWNAICFRITQRKGVLYWYISAYAHLIATMIISKKQGYMPESYRKIRLVFVELYYAHARKQTLKNITCEIETWYGKFTDTERIIYEMLLSNYLRNLQIAIDLDASEYLSNLEVNKVISDITNIPLCTGVLDSTYAKQHAVTVMNCIFDLNGIDVVI